MSPLSRLRVLVTEDDHDTRALLEIILAAAGCEVVITDEPNEALRLAQTTSFDLYLLDNWLANLSGVDLCRRLREFDSTTPVLFYSGAAFESDKREAMEAGAQGYITKPADTDEIVTEVMRLVSEAQIRNRER